jgi:hypothetical protein
MTSAVTWLVAAGLAGLAGVIHGLRNRFNTVETSTKYTQQAVKALMRSDLVKRYKECRDAGYMKDDRKDEWLSDYDIYCSLDGKNGYLDSIHQKVIDMPAEPSVMREGTD